jgi:hypothetical protein
MNHSLGFFNGFGDLGQTGWATPQVAIVQFAHTISIIIGILTVCGALWFMFQLILGAINWISSGSDKQSLENAKKRILNSIIGLLLVIFAYAFLGLIGYIMGVDFLNLENILYNLYP